ncbi:MAG: thiamine phosphate synthase [Halofilum sp. (in: g-proteobacteria)]
MNQPDTRPHPSIPRGLYAIADRETIAGEQFEQAVEAALRGGAVMLQYRDKGTDRVRRRHEAERLVHACRRFGARSIINDDPALAVETGADGVHVGTDAGDPAAIRARLGSSAIIGVSCYDRLDLAVDAQAAGADYVAFGRMYPSTTKPGGPRPDFGLLARAGAATGLPVCAIGGIDAARAPELIAAGADLLAVIGDLFQREDVAARAAEYATLFATGSASRHHP